MYLVKTQFHVIEVGFFLSFASLSWDFAIWRNHTEEILDEKFIWTVNSIVNGPFSRKDWRDYFCQSYSLHKMHVKHSKIL